MMVRESIPGQVDKKSGVPEEEKGVWNFQGGGKDKCLFFSPSTFSTFFVFFKPRIDDYTTNNSF